MSPAPDHPAASTQRASAPRRGARRRRAAAVAGLAVAIMAVVLLVLASQAGQGGSNAPAPTVAGAAGSPGAAGASSAGAASGGSGGQVAAGPQLVFRPASFSLVARVQAPASVSLEGDQGLLIGGRNDAGASVAVIEHLTASAATRLRRLPAPVADAAAGNIGGTAYLFGGGTDMPSSAISSLGADGRPQVVDQLPTPTSDAGVAVIAGTAYIVGGYTGRSALSTVVAWQPGIGSHIVASLPAGVRFPAVAAVGGQLIIAGGTTDTGASRAVFDFDPDKGEINGVTALPDRLTHSAAAVLAGRVYLLGGRLAAQGTQTDRILVYDPTTGKVSQAGGLPRPLSDVGAVALSDQILLAGGVDHAGRLHDEVYVGSVQ